MYETTDFIIDEGRLIRYHGTDTEVVTVPDGVTTIGARAFRRLRELRNVILPVGVTEICERAFEDCNGLEQVQFPDGLTHIGDMAFRNCGSLTEVHLPDSLMHLGDHAFWNCDRLARLDIPPHVTDSDTAFVGCNALADEHEMVIVNHILHDYLGEAAEVTVPDGVVHLGDVAFWDNFALQHIHLPDSVRSVGSSTFWNCAGLADADGFVIVRGTLYDCLRVTAHVVIPPEVTRIGEGALDKVLRVEGVATRITVPEGVSFLGNYAFGYMDKEDLVQIEVKGCPQLHPKAFHGVRCLLAPRLPWAALNDAELRQAALRGFLTDPDAYKANPDFENYCKYAVRQRKKLLPDMLAHDAVTPLAFWLAHTKTTPEAFEREYLTPAVEAHAVNCTAFLLEWKQQHFSAVDVERQLHRALTKSPYNKEAMKALWSWKTQDNGTLMLTEYKGDSADVVVPARIGRKAVTAIGEELFRNRAALQSVYIESGITTIGAYAFAECADLTDVTLPDSVTCLGEAIFRDCARLPRIELPDSVERIASSLFANCRGLQEVRLPTRLTEIGSYAFLFCKQLTHLDVPSGVTNIAQFAFYGCEALEKLDLPDTVQNIESHAFIGCTKLADADGFFILQQRLYAYLGTAACVTVPDGVTYIAPDIFYGHATLTSVTIPGSVKYIERESFSGCTALTQVTLADGVEKIGWCAFFGSRNLERIVLPSSVVHIHSLAFSYCHKLTICAPRGSYAEIFAAEQGIPFEEVIADE